MNIPQWQIDMDYIETCNCNFGCPCNFNGYPTDGKCQSMAAFRVRRGHYGETSLDGVKIVLTATWPGAIHHGGGTARVHIDRAASGAQREAILAIFSGKAKGSGPFELFAQTFSTFIEPNFTDIEMHIDGRHSRYRIPGIAEVELEPFTNPVSGDVQDIQVHMPQGFIFKTALAGRSRVMKLLGVGPLSYDHTGKNGFFAEVSYAGP